MTGNISSKTRAAIFLLASAAAGVAGMAQPVVADERLLPGESVADRDRPELDALGLPLGAFRLYPAIDMAAEYDSNLFARDDDEQEDMITLLRPRLELEADWTRHDLELSLASEIASYDKSPQEDYEDLLLDGDLRFDLTRTSELRLQGAWHDLHEERSSPDDVDGLVPTEFSRRRLAALFARRVGRIVVDGRYQRTRHDYDDVPGSTGLINNDDRDRLRQAIDLRAGFKLSRDLDLLLRAEADNQEYEQEIDDNGLNRSSRGLRAGLGIEGTIGGAGFIEAFAGYAERQYLDPQLADNQTPWFDARYIWSPSGLTTVTLAARRSIEETTFAPASGYRATKLELSVDHELLRNLLLGFSVSGQDDDYVGVDRQDRRVAAAFTARYLTNRYLQISLRIGHRNRVSQLAGVQTDDFDINTATLTFTLQR